MVSLSVQQIYHLGERKGDGLEGYRVQKMYHDPQKIKQERQTIEAMSKGEKKKSSKSIHKNKPKESFLAEVEKIASKIPAPGHYNPKDGDFDKIKGPSKSAIKSTDRITLFDGLQKQAKKNNFPSAQTYQIKDSLIDKRRRSSLSKAQGSTFIQNTMGISLQTPGAGQYNINNKQLWQSKGLTKWVKTTRNINQNKRSSLPGVGSYSPNPLAYNLFSDRKPNLLKDKFSKSSRFSKQQGKTSIGPAYNIMSQWGIKNKKQQDILKKVYNRSSSKSVYH